jgi:hypothetical protein
LGNPVFVEQQIRGIAPLLEQSVAGWCAPHNTAAESARSPSNRVRRSDDLLSWKHYRWGMPEDHAVEFALHLRIDSKEERAALEQALLRARATELAEVRRNQVRLSAGYGDATTRDAMSGEAGRAQLRWTMLDRLLAELRRGRDAPGGES